jgi:hypothetical protein
MIGQFRASRQSGQARAAPPNSRDREEWWRLKLVENHAVPCGSCQHCCTHEWIFLRPEEGDVAEIYETVDIISPATGLPAKALAHKPNGDCIYLSGSGCTIHGRHPAVCRAFDCRRFFLQVQTLPRTERRRQMREVARFEETYDIGKRMQEEFPV